MMDSSAALLSFFPEAGDDGKQQTAVFVLHSHGIILRRLIPLCWQVCAEIWSLAFVPRERVPLEWLVKHVTSLYLVEPDRQGTYVCVLGLVINTWAVKLPLLLGKEGTSLHGSRKIRWTTPRVYRNYTHVRKQAQMPRSNKKQVHGSFSAERDKQNHIYSVRTDGIIHSGFTATHTYTHKQTHAHRHRVTLTSKSKPSSHLNTPDLNSIMKLTEAI